MKCRLVVGALLLSLSPVAAPAHAGVVFVMDRASLGGDDFVDWGVLGPAGPVPNPFMITSNGGLAMTCQQTLGRIWLQAARSEHRLGRQLRPGRSPDLDRYRRADED